MQVPRDVIRVKRGAAPRREHEGPSRAIADNGAAPRGAGSPDGLVAVPASRYTNYRGVHRVSPSYCETFSKKALSNSNLCSG